MNEEQLVLNNLNLAYSIAIKYRDYVKNYYEFEDAVQMCYEGLIKAAQTYDDTKGIAFSTYAYTVIKNHLITPPRLNYNKTSGVLLLSLDDENEDGLKIMDTVADDIDIEEKIANENQIKLLYECINELPELQKTILLLRCQDMTFAQIAKQLNRTEGYITQNYQKGLTMLRCKFRRKLR